MALADDVLVNAWITRRDADAFAEIVSRYSAMVYATSWRILGNPIDAEDLAQECFIELVRIRRPIKRSLAGWLHTAAVNKSLNRLKAERHRKERESRFAEEVNMHSEAEWSEVQVHIDEAIAALPDKLREPVILRFLHSQTQDAIAERLGVSRFTIQRRLEKALEQMREFLKRRGIPVGAAALAAMLGANMTEAASATLTATLGKLALAGATGAIGYSVGSTTTGSIAALGGVLAMKKAVLGIVVVLACILALRALKHKHEPEPAEIARQTDVSQPERPSPEGGAGALALLKTLSERAAKEDHAVSESKEEESSETETTSKDEGGVISGRVYDAISNVGIEGVNMVARSSEGRTMSTASDNSGAYRFTDLADGTYEVSCNAQGYQQMGPKSVTVILSDGKAVNDVDFALVQGIRIAGKVVDRQGHPVEDADVAVPDSAMDSVGKLEYTKSRNDGSFELHLPRQSNSLLRLQARKDILESEILGLITVPPNGLDGLVLRLTTLRTASISGTVVDPAVRPVVGATIGLVRDRSSSADILPSVDNVQSGTDGSFSIMNIPAGEYGIRVRAMEVGRRNWRWFDELMRVELKDGQALTGLRLVLGADKGGLAIAGRVVDTAGNPIPGASVNCQAPESQGGAYSVADGSFRVTGLTEGEYKFYVEHPSYSRSSDKVRAIAGSQGVVITLEAKADVEGRVVRADTGEPLTSFQVLVVEGHRRQVDVALFTDGRNIRDPEGRFKLTGVNVGDAAVMARAPGFTPAFVNLTVTEQKVTNVELRLKPGEALVGQVVDAVGDPIPDAMIYVGGISNLYWPQNFLAKSRSDGEFVIEDFPPEYQWVTAYHTDYAPAASRVSKDTKIVLERPSKLEGKVTRGGTPIAGEVVDLRYPSDVPVLTGITGSDGTFSLENLIPGTVAVRALRTTQTAVLQPGQTTHLDFVAESGTAVVEGRITVRGEPPKNAYVQLVIMTTNGEEWHSDGAEADGSYRLEGLSAGNATLQLTSLDWHEEDTIRSQRLEFPIAEGEAIRHDIDFTGGGRVTGRVFGVGRVPLGWVQVWALSGEVQIPATPDLRGLQLLRVNEASSGPDGNYQIQYLEPGTYTLLAVMQDRSEPGSEAQFASRVVTIQGDETVNVDFDFR